MRLNITETPAFLASLKANKRVEVPALTVFRDHGKQLFLGTFIALATFVLFYLMTVFTLSWATTRLGFSRHAFLLIQLFAVLFFGMAIPVSAWLADRFGRQKILILASVAIAIFGLAFGWLFGTGGMSAGDTILQRTGNTVVSFSGHATGTLASIGVKCGASGGAVAVVEPTTLTIDSAVVDDASKASAVIETVGNQTITIAFDTTSSTLEVTVGTGTEPIALASNSLS